MKVAFHFDEDALQDGNKATTQLLEGSRSHRLSIRSRVFIGSLLIETGAADRSRHGDTIVQTIDQRAYLTLLEEWLSPQPFNWFALLPAAIEVIRNKTVFCVLFDTLEPRVALQLHSLAMAQMPEVYLGALQVDESLRSHLAGYQLCAWARLDGERAFASWDGISDDSKMPWVVELLQKCGFDPVEHEDVAARFTIFDRHATPQATHRIACCRAALVEVFDGVVDSAMIRIGDAMPDLHEKMWSILNSYSNAEVDEQFSNVALGCRRLIEYAADCLFPAIDPAKGGHKLDQSAFKNRVLKYLEENQVSKEDRHLISANVSGVAAELDRLLDLVHKGVHALAKQEQARRCLLRTVLLLDDLCAVSREGFPVRISLDKNLIEKIARPRPPKATGP